MKTVLPKLTGALCTYLCCLLTIGFPQTKSERKPFPSIVRFAFDGEEIGMGEYRDGKFSITNIQTFIYSYEGNNYIINQFRIITNGDSAYVDSSALYLECSGSIGEGNKLIIAIPLFVDPPGSGNKGYIPCRGETHICHSAATKTCSCCGFQRDGKGCIIGCYCDTKAKKCQGSKGLCAHTLTNTNAAAMGIVNLKRYPPAD